MRFREALASAIRAQARCNSAVQDVPACILWPDRERQWEQVVTRLLFDLPELYILGNYVPESRTGPAIWLRCVLDRALPTEQNPLESRPLVFYLPGVSRSDLRAISTCPPELAPLAELQYRGVIWSHPNGRDWTPFAFLSSDKGLGLSVTDDAATKDALRNSLCRFLDEDISRLKGQILDAVFFNKLLIESPERDLLAWLDDPNAAESSWSIEKRAAFEKICRKTYHFSPMENGVIEACALLAKAEGAWATIWSIYADAPERYLGIFDKLMVQKPSTQGLLIEDTSHYPRVNEEQEDKLREELLALANLPREQAREKILQLEIIHAERRGWVWNQLGHADLACALERLVELSQLVGLGGGANNLEGLRAIYEEKFWRCDAAALEALACVKSPKDRAAIQSALRAVYLPWLDEHANLMQQFVLNSAKPFRETASERSSVSYEASECILFVDGLRYDLGKKLAQRLEAYGTVSFSSRWSALPSVTAVGKYAVSPLASGLYGALYDGEPVVTTIEGTLITSARLGTLLASYGFETLDGSSLGNTRGKAWDEHGDIDAKGHSMGAKLAREIDLLLDEIIDRVVELLEAGWHRVHIVTDHGWLLMPGGLPKVAIPASFTQSKWGRTGVLSSAAPVNIPSYLWDLAPEHRLVTAPGAGSFIEGREYSHGGISIQENLLPVIVIEGKGQVDLSERLSIQSIRWTQLRCEVRVAGAPENSRVDIRTNAATAQPSIANQPKTRSGEVATLIVPDEDKEGAAVHVVVLAPDGSVLIQETTTVGG